MNVENDFLTDFDLFGKQPELYYKGKSKKASTLGIVLTVIYIALYITFLLYKLIRMFKRIDVTFYDSYTFKGLPSIKLTNNEFYGGFGMGGIVDERMYYINVTYVSKVKVNGKWKETVRVMETETCQLDWFGSEYREVFADQPLQNYYCIKDFSGMVLEGYGNLERFSYFNIKFYPCVGFTKDGRECYDYITKLKFFTVNTVELKFQDNDLNPEDYEKPIIRTEKDMNSPVFKDMYQLIYSYLQIVNIETDEDITGLNFFTDTIRKEQYMKYENSFLIASPLFYGDILETGGPICDATLQLSARVLTEKRQYTQLIDVLGDVGGLMEILLTFLNILSSFVTEILYDRALVNDLFSFDLEKKLVVVNSRLKSKKSFEDKNMLSMAKEPNKRETINPIENEKELEEQKSITIYSKEILNDPRTINKSKTTRKKIKKKKLTNRSNNKPSHQVNNFINEKIQNNENKLSFEENENKNIISIENKINDQSPRDTANIFTKERKLTNLYINNLLIYCFWCTSRKKNINKALFEEGSKLLTQRLDILNMFNHFYAIELMQKNMEIELKDMPMSDNCKNCIQLVNAYNNFKIIDN